MTTNQPEVSLKRVGRILHHVQWQHLFQLQVKIEEVCDVSHVAFEILLSLTFY